MAKSVSSAPTCIIHQIALEHAEAEKLDSMLTDRLEAAKKGSREHEIYSDYSNNEFHSLLHDIRAKAALHNASSLEGALFQVAIASDLLGELIDYTDDERGKEDQTAGPSRSWRIGNLERKLDRILWSIRRAIEDATGADAGRDFGCDPFMPRYCAKSRTAAELFEDAEDLISLNNGGPSKRNGTAR